MSKRAILLGGGGHGVSLADAVLCEGYTLDGVLDRELVIGSEILPGLKVIGGDDRLVELHRDGVRYAFIGVGGATDNRLRKHLYEAAVAAGYELPAVIHPDSSVGPGCLLGPAVQILAGSSVGSRCLIGANAIVNQGAVVCHDCVIGDHAHIAPGSTLGGSVHIGREATIGLGATVLLGVMVGTEGFVHMGVRVTHSVPDGHQINGRGEIYPLSA
ncbi:hypothetical protein JCM17960_25890 [Magnetospira thiophila]